MRGLIDRVAILAVPVLFGCGDCTAGPVGPGLVVEVYDAATGRRPPVFTIVARDGTYADTAQGPGDFEGPEGTGRALLAWGRPGTYTVQVDAVGYALWTRAGTRVRQDGCQVQPTPVRVALARSLSNTAQLRTGP